MKPSQILESGFPFSPTPGQKQVFEMLDEFLLSSERAKQVFLLKGYAGTGKTSVISRLTQVLPQLDLKFVLLAPTGRAAKVMAMYSGMPAFTIHKHIYMKVEDEIAGDPVFQLKTNIASKTVYIIDEASMISDESGIGENGLLADIFSFIFTKKSNKLIFVGDTAQLPPVNQSQSPALNGELLKTRFDIKLSETELTEVVRQESRSGILENATLIREAVRRGEAEVKISVKSFRDFYRMGGDRLEEGLNYAYRKFGIRDTMVITRSNKAATLYNRYIRSRIHWMQEELQAGDMLIVVKNNYTVLPEEISNGFLANGDFVEVVKVKKTYEMHGFRFADVDLKLVDEKGEPEFEAKIFLNLLFSNTASLSREEQRLLYQSVMQDYLEIKNLRERRAAIKNDSFLNALQVKFAYALTCHKSQGGQWAAVFIDQGYLTEDMINTEYFRWLYTAVTRGQKEVFMVNFDSRFF